MKNSKFDNHRFKFNNLILHLLFAQFVLFIPKIGATSKLFPFGPEERDATLSRDSDETSAELRLSVPVLFYGRPYNSIFINQNGLVSFQTEIPAFVNIPFPLDYPSIAPLYSDIDIRLGGSVNYRETNNPDNLERVRVLIDAHFSSAANFNPIALVLITWDNVGYFDRRIDKKLRNAKDKEEEYISLYNTKSQDTNTFQVVIANDGGESYVLLVYDKIEWIQGSGKNPSLPDAKAQAGLISGIGPHFTLKGSGSDQASTLCKRSNLGVEGVWGFRIGRVTDLIEEPDLNIGEDATSETISSCAVGSSICHSHAECTDFNPGFCCKCSEGFYGNGKTCLPAESPQRVVGKVKGILNGVAIEDADFYSYILPADGRAYTAVAKIPERLGYDMQTVSVLGTIIGWLFSISIKGAPNGFHFTGGSFNYTADVTFQLTGQKVSVIQNFGGLDVFNQLKVDTRIHGTTAVVPVGKSIEIPDYEMLLTRVSPGIIRSQSSHNFRVQGTSMDNPFTIEQTIMYEECQWSSPVKPELESTKMKIGRHYFMYDAGEQIVRYATTSKITPTDGADPCKENKDKCGPNSSCVAMEDSFKCICDLGYEELYQQDAQQNLVPQCVDIDECRTGISTCDITALCVNLPGSHKCDCQPGYSGDGYTCSKLLTCMDVQCGSNAQCLEVAVGEPECRCLHGFYGDGLTCIRETGHEMNPGIPPDCRHLGICDRNAECIFSHDSNSHICSCRPGYYGEGITCYPDPRYTESNPVNDCRGGQACHPFADCVNDRSTNTFVCKCRDGYYGDGVRCLQLQTQVPVGNDCRSGIRCDSFAECVLHPITNAYTCQCRPGFTGDGIRCLEDTSETCEVENRCNKDADCRPDEYLRRYVCVCRKGFFGDGYKCDQVESNQHEGLSPEPTCSFPDQCWCPSGFAYDDIYGKCIKDISENQNCNQNPSLCDTNARCIQREDTFTCQCNQGFSGDGNHCLPQNLCTSQSQCHQYGECAYNRTELRFRCKCRDGFIGDGNDCRPSPDAGCDILRNCDVNGRCVWKAENSKYECECQQGYIGDGLNCVEDMTGCNVLNNCHRYAECMYDSIARGYRCSCKQGYEGDGTKCRSLIPCYQDKTVCDANAECGIVSTTREWKCQCKQGFFGDGYECREAGRRDNQFLFLAKGMSIIQVPLDGNISEPILVEPQNEAIGIDIDCVNEQIFWSDVGGRAIKQSSYNGSGKTTLFNEEIGSPEGISFDWTARNLYWTDSLKDTIEVASLETKNRKTLISTQLVNPRGIAVYPQRGRLFWSDWDRNNPRIEFSGLDGLGRQTLVADGLVLPNSLVIDFATDQLCFADAGSHKIECVGVDGRNRRTFISDASHPFGIALSADTFYYSDWNTMSIERSSRTTNKREESIPVFIGGRGKLYGLVLVPNSCPQAYNPCNQNACGADRICLPNIRGGRSCRCTNKAGPNCKDEAY